MRKKTKENVKELLKTLEEANRKLPILASGEYSDILKGVLETCQGIAIRAGTAIESEEGQGTEAVRVLEDYCEEIYQAQAWKENSMETLDALVRKADEALKSLPTTYEVVFFPYKASMWDCMESVWKAAETRENCSCHVVPIPYYSKDSDGNLNELCYEGDDFPAEVPIEAWDTFQLQEMQPDIIFIHNPYDHQNYVTTIHPFFYSENLKKYTEHLVLLPYAVSSKEHVAEEFSISQGILHADHVFMQSHNLCREQIAWFHKYEDAWQARGHYGNAEEKFQTFGSPKFDKAVNAKREDYEYPDEWIKKVRLEDGGRKPVFFFNTSLNQLLHDGDVYLQKTRHVLHLFRQNKNVLLLWRPHPLMGQTFLAMRPSMLKEYQDMVQAYQNEDWGIYDTSADLYAAITFSDVYYGDWSSVATLFQCAGKPVILENYRLFRMERLAYRTPLEAQQMNAPSFCMDRSKLYLYDRIGNVVYCIDIESGQASVVTMLPHGFYTHIEKVGGYLVCVPGNESNIVLYHLKTGKTFELAKDKAQSYRFCYAYGQHIFLTPLLGRNILRVDIKKDGTLEVKKLWNQKVESEGGKKKDYQSCGLPMALENKIFIPYQNAYGVAEFDCRTQKVVRFHDLPDCATMAFDGKRYWWCDIRGQLHVWDYDSGVSTFIHDFRKELEREPDDLMVYFLAYAQGYLFLLPHQYYPDMENKAFRIDVESREIQEVPGLRVHADTRIEPNRSLRCYCGAKVNEQFRICTYCNARNTVIQVDPVTCEINEVSMRVTADCLTDNQSAGYILEAEPLLTEYFLEYWGNSGTEGFAQDKRRSLLETRAWKQVKLRNAQNGVQDIGMEYRDGKCGERIIHYLMQQLGERDE